MGCAISTWLNGTTVPPGPRSRPAWGFGFFGEVWCPSLALQGSSEQREAGEEISKGPGPVCLLCLTGDEGAEEVWKEERAK